MGLARALWGPALALILATGAAAAPLASVTPRLKPPPPGPSFATRSDLQLLKDVKAAIDKRSFAIAKSLAGTIGEPTARSLAQWLYFYAEDPLVGLAEADAFLDTHPGWPALAKIQTHVEKRIPNTAPAPAILAFFATRDPVTGEGKLQLARAMFATGERDAAILQIRDAWRERNFILADEQRLVSLYGAHLLAEDHVARADRLLWSREVTAARRVFAKLPARERRMAEARAALLVGARNGPGLFDQLPSEDRLDSGVLHAAVRHHRRLEQEPRAIVLARQAPSDPAALRNPARWWEERQLLMRWALKEKRYADAYALAAGHGLDPGTEYAEAEFNAGWIALRFLNAPERAETHFAALANSVGAPISVSRAFYWLGRAADARGATQAAQARYARAARHAYAYYGQLAAERLVGGPPAEKFAPPTTATPEERARFSSRPLVAALRILADLGDDQTFLVFAYQADDELDSAGEYVELARLAERAGATHAAVRAGKVAVGRNAFAPEVAYPLIFVPEEAARFAPAEMILGISRQESEFNPRAFSRAGARGLMQLIPSTAQITARKEGLRYNRAALLDDPQYNLTIGSAHLSHLLTRFGRSHIMTFAAYNAGASRVDEWIGRYGDPRAGYVDPVDWVEQIPFAETRNYVQRVLENMQVYRARLGDAPLAGRLAADLDAGGPVRRAGLLPGARYALALPPLPERTARLASAAPIAGDEGAHLLPQPEGSPAALTGDGAPAGAEPADAEVSPDGVSATAEDLPAAAKADFIGDAPRPKRPAARPRRTSAPAPSPKFTPAPEIAMQPAPAPENALPDARAPESALESAPAQETAPAASSAAARAPATAPAAARAAEPPVAAELDQEGAASPSPAEAAAAAECVTYRDYIAANAGAAASAADLNAGMLAELKGGGLNCAPDAAAENAVR